jgi:hypothetical protein
VRLIDGLDDHTVCGGLMKKANIGEMAVSNFVSRFAELKMAFMRFGRGLSKQDHRP